MISGYNYLAVVKLAGWILFRLEPSHAILSVHCTHLCLDFPLYCSTSVFRLRLDADPFIFCGTHAENV
uniref:Uncharacterized protein n=1 Tax=Physcomitrium patens TaxID=3218 RepID=A0A2K1IVZ6_PHYPA|nr:hypothetical protein PHYPA_025398 [Physcomitrium patens]